MFKIFFITKCVKGTENIIENEKFFIASSHQSIFETFYLQTLSNSLIIFPQGTRVLPIERPQFKKGASRIYERLKISCQPLAINSGYVWPKSGLKKSHKLITISILKQIKPGYSKEEFIRILQKSIYSELDLLN